MTDTDLREVTFSVRASATTRRTSSTAAVLLGLAAAPTAQGAVTLGAPLNLPANNQTCQQFSLIGPPPSCTFFGFAPQGQPASWTPQTPRGQWVIVRVRVRAGAVTGPMVAAGLRAFRSQTQNPGPAPAGCCTVNAQSQIFTPAPNEVTQIATRIPVVNTVQIVDGEPVELVDYLGLKVLNATTHLPMTNIAGAIGTFFPQAVPAGQTEAMTGSFTNRAPLIQADYEPDADGDGFGDETQDSCATDPAIRSRPVATAAQCAVAPGAPAPGPAPPVGTPPAPGVSLSALRDVANFGSQRSAQIPVVCPAGSPATCTGSIAATTVKRFSTRSARSAATKTLTIRAKTYRVRPGAVARVGLTLPAQARRELRRRGRLSLNVTMTQTAPTPGSTTRRITVRRVPTSYRANAKGRVSVRVSVPAGIDRAKKATYELRRRGGKKARVARRSLSMTSREGRVTTVRLSLNRSARSSLRRNRSVKFTLRATYRNDAGKTVRLNRTVTIRRR